MNNQQRLTAASRLCPADEKAARQLRELQVKLDDFEKVKLIGRGAYGEVRLVSPGNSSLFSISFSVFLFLAFLHLGDEPDWKFSCFLFFPPLNNGGNH